MSSQFSKLQPGRRTLAALTACALGLASHVALAQTGGGGQGGGGQGGGGTIGTSPFSGVAVDADGVLELETPDPTGRLLERRAAEAFASLDPDVARPSELRKVSLTRLLAVANRAITAGRKLDDTMLRLAGLTRVQYVFYYPETKDIVIAGPAEGWVESPNGRIVGLESGAPMLELQDLVVALRTFAPGARKNPLVSCSIDPTQDGLARMQQFLNEIGSTISGPGDEQFIVDGLRESLGLQVITVGGVPASTHFAQVLVEADYRMKLIGIGLEEPPVGIRSYVAMANPAAVARNAMQRWYFVPDYQRIKVTDDGQAAEFVGLGVKLVGEDEVVAAHGGRTASGGQNRASAQFTRSFTENYAELAEVAPVYAQLRNCIDLLVASAFITRHELWDQAGVDLGALGDESQYKVETYNPPKQVATAVNSMWKNRRLMTPVGGGVEIRAAKALEDGNVLADDGSVAEAHDAIDLSSLPANQWWWD
jgi:hypothetical protein